MTTMASAATPIEEPGRLAGLRRGSAGTGVTSKHMGMLLRVNKGLRAGQRLVAAPEAVNSPTAGTRWDRNATFLGGLADS